MTLFDKRADGSAVTNSAASITRVIKVAAITLGVLVPVQALAQTAPAPVQPPPVRSAIDSNGVDLISLKVSATDSTLTIGGDNSRLSYARRFVRNSQPGSAATNLDGYVDAFQSSATLAYVVLGDRSELFDAASYVYTAREGSSSTLVYNASTQIWTYRRDDGLVAIFDGNHLNSQVTDQFGGLVNEIMAAKQVR